MNATTLHMILNFSTSTDSNVNHSDTNNNYYSINNHNNSNNISLVTWTPSYNDHEKEWKEILGNWRYAFQRILVPMLSIVGVVGNSITIVVLTRRNMQSSTYFYLTALAVSDLLYLLFVFSLSLKHIPGMSKRSRWLYWEYFRFAYWLCDATSSTSTWLTVAFTIERYIAVCYPMKRKIFCTQTRAKRIIGAVYLLCFASTVTTPYEWVVSPNPNTDNTTLLLDYSSLGANTTYKKAFYWYTAVFFILVPIIFLTVFNSCLILAVKRSQVQRNHLTQRSKLSVSCSGASFMSHSDTETPTYSERGPRFETQPITKRPLNSFQRSGGSFGRTRAGQSVIRESSHENKITRMLIAVVLLAILCQMPTALMLIYTSFTEFEKGTSAFYVSRILGNIFNFLASANAASNFVLYCAMSDKFRKTFLQTFCSKWLSKRRFQESSYSFQGTVRRCTSVRTSTKQLHITSDRLSWKRETSIESLRNRNASKSEDTTPTYSSRGGLSHGGLLELKVQHINFEETNPSQDVTGLKESISREPLLHIVGLKQEAEVTNP